LCTVALAATAFAWPESSGGNVGDSWAPRATDVARAAEYCHRWAVEATGVNPVAEAERPYVTPPNAIPEEESERSLRFSRGYDSCLASLGLMYR
jgi:hypothetical protein